MLAGKVDLVTIASPGVTHHEIASAMLKAGIDVLLEKPMAETLAQARDLAALASASGRILQIGHLERFNPAVVHLHSIVKNPRFVECHRLAPFTERGTDVDVVLDLMVHDLDVILSVAPSEVASLEAVGVAILTDRIDLANARVRFQSGLIANLVIEPRVGATRAQDSLLSARRVHLGRLRGAQHPDVSVKLRRCAARSSRQFRPNRSISAKAIRWPTKSRRSSSPFAAGPRRRSVPRTDCA